MASRPNSSPELAIGVLSAPEFTERRMGLRASWLRWPAVASGQVVARFATRCLGAPAWLAEVLRVETRRFADITCLNVQYNETRLRGPVLMLAAWLAHAPRAFPTVGYVAKVDDDSYVHIPRLVQLLRAVHAPHRLVYLGKLSWFHWLPRIFEHAGFGFERTLANRAGSACRNSSSSMAQQYGACEGPFPFASGYLIVVSTAMADALTASPGLQADVARLAQAPTESLRKLNGKQQKAIMEDAWLASIPYRFPLGPVSYLTLGEGGRDDRPLVSDGWGLWTTRTALLVHVRSKAVERQIAVHDFFRGPARQCNAQMRVECPSEQGCSTFATRNERRRRRRAEAEAKRRRVDRFWQKQLSWLQVNGAKLEHAFCATGQYCRVVIDRTRDAHCREGPFYEEVDLIGSTRTASVLERAQAAMDESREILSTVAGAMPPDVRAELLPAGGRRPQPPAARRVPWRRGGTAESVEKSVYSFREKRSSVEC